MNADPETGWMLVERWRSFRSQTPDPAVEATKKLRSTVPTSDTCDSTKIDLTDAETRKRALVETTDADDDEPAEKYWRAEDFVAKASMDELTGRWLADEIGIFDRDAAEDTWADCQGAGGALDKQAEAEASEKALDSLLAHGVVEDMKREDATKFKSLTTRWEKGWRMKDSEWKMMVRFVGREYKWAEHREGLFSPGATHSADRVIDFLASKKGFETFEADAVDVHHQAPEYEEVVVVPAPQQVRAGTPGRRCRDESAGQAARHGVVEGTKREGAVGEGLAHDRRRVEHEGTVCGTQVQLGPAFRGSVFSWSNTFSQTCDRLQSSEVGLGDVRGRCCGLILPGS